MDVSSGLAIVGLAALAFLNLLEKRRMSAALERVKASVADTKSATDSVIVLVTNLAAQIRDHVANNDDAALNSLADQLDAERVSLAKLVTDNTGLEGEQPSPNAGGDPGPAGGRPQGGDPAGGQPQAPAPLTVDISGVGQGIVGQPYTGSVFASGGVAPYTFAFDPAGVNGLTFGDTGDISGTPNEARNDAVTVKVTDSADPPVSASEAVTLVIGGPADGLG